jgi:hypothetical protein
MKRHLAVCHDCSEKRKTKNNASYHNHHRIHQAAQAMTEQLSSRGEKLYEARRDCAGMRERLAVLQKRYDSLQVAYEESQKMLASALDRANGGTAAPGAPALPSAVSVRNESVVVQRLQELTELMTDWRAHSTGEVETVARMMHDEREQAKGQMDMGIGEIERLLGKLTVNTK